jgi:hypothetical protein
MTNGAWVAFIAFAALGAVILVNYVHPWPLALAGAFSWALAAMLMGMGEETR